ncbi:alpha-glucosidase [Oscillospiraceae bacterium HV4-5-C5C]|nr:alpha-glucosidase [Oscillospiraceae bacterium HV4-5-C5C]
MSVNAHHWWQEAVIYQVYPRSFQDSNGDGVGDLPGLIRRLDYLRRLGVDAIWLSPVYRSPQEDNGYDISDYQDIDPMFGSLADMDRLIAEARLRGIRIIMDLVLNHTSDRHRWFQEALKGRDNPYHDFYIWRDGQPGQPPNDMRACFGGSAWQWVPQLQQYYFHQFAVAQPDLNWDNPAVREALYDMIRWWMKRGVGGFRLDVIDQIAKDPDLGITNNGPRLHELIREMNQATFGNGDYVTVGETWGATPQIARLFSQPDGSEFSMVFQFEHIGLDQKPGGQKWDLAPLDLVRLKQVLSGWQRQLYGCGWNSLFWNNHDLPRIVSRWGSDKPAYREVSAKMLATLLYGFQGTPYIYQGEELGMTNAYLSLEDCRDIESLNLYRERLEEGYAPADILRSIQARGRDNARTPMQWDDSPQAGFSSGEPWIKVNPNYSYINAAAQVDDPDSVFCYYQKLINLRKQETTLIDGSYTLLAESDPDLFMYVREWDSEQILTVVNFHAQERPQFLPEHWKQANCLIHNYPGPVGETLRPFEAFMLKHW